MAVTFYMDHNSNGAVTTGLRRLGVDCLTADEDARRSLDDELLLARATSLGRTLVSSDSDMLDIAGRWQAAGRTFAGVVYGHPFRFTVGGAIADLKLMHDYQDADDLQNQIVHLPL